MWVFLVLNSIFSDFFSLLFSRLKKERSFSGVIYDMSSGGGAGSPGSMRRKPPDLRHQLPSASKLRTGQAPPPPSAKMRSSSQSHSTSSSIADSTVIFIPGLDVKVAFNVLSSLAYIATTFICQTVLVKSLLRFLQVI